MAKIRVESSFKYDEDLNVTNIEVCVNTTFWWRGTADGEIYKARKKLIIAEIKKLYKKENR